MQWIISIVKSTSVCCSEALARAEKARRKIQKHTGLRQCAIVLAESETVHTMPNMANGNQLMAVVRYGAVQTLLLRRKDQCRLQGLEYFKVKG